MEQLTEEVAKDVAASPQEWMRFLNTASRLYKYTFPEQLLIYAQRPEATAVASMEIWNQKMYRWIKKGSKGIALIDNTSGPKTKLRYVFDVQDTYKVRNLGKDPQLWNLPVEGEHLVADYLQEQLSLEDTEGGLAESLHQAAKESMQEWLPDALEELRLDVTGTFLEELDEQNQEVEFRELMTNSVWYVLLNRCGLDVQEYLDAEDFRHITDFNQLKILGHLGSAVNEISRPVLMQIGRYVLNDLENDLKTVAKEKELAYNEFNTLIRESNTDNTEDREEKKEEADYERDQLQPERRVSDSRYQPGRDERNDREVRNDEERVSEKSQGSQVQHSDTAEPSGQSSDGDRQSGKTESRQPDERTSGERSGTGQDGRHNGVDQTHEPDQSTGRGTGDPGDYLQLSLFPTEEEQLGEIRKAAAALEQPAAFLISDEMVDDILRTGSGQKNTLFHITARLIEGLDNEEMQSFLKDEYRTGGKGFTIDGQKISIWYDNDGIRIRRGDSARRNFDRIVTWEEAADRIRDMYEEGNYVDNLISNNAIEQEQKEMTDLLALHFRDTSRNREEQLSYSDWQDVVGAAWTDPEEAAATAYSFEWLQEDIPYGKPLANQKYYILDQNMEDCPDWVPGTLYIAGDGVAQGYLNDKEKTEEKFVVLDRNGERLYCTGDMGRYWNDGNIEFLGRLDNQVKINGYRVELGEIEAAVSDIFPENRSVVIPIKRNNGIVIIGIVEGKLYYDEKIIKKKLESTIPKYEIPKRIFNINEFPLTDNGKINRKKLAEEYQYEEENNKEKTEITTPLERGLLDEYENILGIRVSVDKEFFSIGGDSLNALKLIRKINEKYNIVITIKDLYENASVRKLAKRIIEKTEDYNEGIL